MELFVCGRVCLFGEHSDWAATYRNKNQSIEKGYALVAGLNQGIYANVFQDKNFVINISPSVKINASHYLNVSADRETLFNIATSDSFYAYAAAAAYKVQEKYNVGGIKIDITRNTLPIKKGLASSAAICTLVVSAYNRAYNLSMTNDEIMELAYYGELVTGSKCGRLDQFCALGEGINLVEFDGENISYQKVDIEKDLYMVLVDLKGVKDTKKILSSLNKCYPVPQNKKQEKAIQYLGSINAKIVEEAKDYIEKGEVESLGQLMTNAQKEFDKALSPICPSQLKSPILHKVLCDEKVAEYAFGGKGVGSQGDGSAQFIAKDANAQKLLIKYLKKQGFEPYALTIRKQKTIKRAMIPVAGYGTRLYPYTKLVRKEFCPIMYKGRLTPQICALLEELYDSGIEEIYLTISNNAQKKLYKDFFCKRTKYLNTYSNNDYEKDFDKKLFNIWKRLRFVKNNKVDNGFAYSISLSKKIAGNEPILLCLGDTNYKSEGHISCTKQLIDFYPKYLKACVGLTLIDLDETKNYGTMLAEKVEGNVFFAKKLYEKPSKEFAEKNMIFRDGKCLAFFGNYILTPKVFDVLEKNIKEKGSKAQFTECLDQVRNEEGFMGLLIDGQSLDYGNVAAYENNFTKLK